MPSKIIATLLVIIVVFQSCQKSVSDFGNPPQSDSTIAIHQAPGAIKDWRIYSITGNDTIMNVSWRFKYDSVARTLYQYETHDTANYSDIPAVSWLYNSKLQLIQMDYGDKSLEAGYSKSTVIDRDALGELKSAEFILQTTSSCSNSIETNRFKGNFTYGNSNGKKTIRFVDTLSNPGGFANLDADYTVYFDAKNRPEYKILNRWTYYDLSCNFLFHPSGDTVFHIQYDPATGYPATITTHYIPLRGQGPVIGSDLEKITRTYHFSNKDNRKISSFFQTYRWGSDLNDWFTFNAVSNLYYILPGDNMVVVGDYQFLKYGVVDRIDITDESLIDNVFSKYVYSTYPQYTFDNAGNITRCIVPGDEFFYEFSY